MSKRFLIMAGGTGGHVYPALGFAELAKRQGHQVQWLGTAAGLEGRVVPENGIKLNTVDIAGVRGKGLKSLLTAPFKIAHAIRQASAAMRAFSPDLVIGFGGYTAGPGGVAARLRRIPLVIHEQNARAGTTNKLLAKIANSVLCAFQGALPKSTQVGNPVRDEILALSQKTYDAQKPVNMLVLGGSLGARFLNETVPVALASLDSANQPVVRHQAGPKLFEEAKASYKQSGIDADITAYIEDMAAAYEWADMVVCRAGAMTVSELAVAGLPALLVPFPYAIDDHQTANAEWLANAGAAHIYQQSENDLKRFTQLLSDMTKDKNTLAEMSAKAAEIGIRDAADQILHTCEELADVA